MFGRYRDGKRTSSLSTGTFAYSKMEKREDAATRPSSEQQKAAKLSRRVPCIKVERRGGAPSFFNYGKEARLYFSGAFLTGGALCPLHLKKMGFEQKLQD